MTTMFLWETPTGERKWEVVAKNQIAGFLKKLLDDGVYPAMIMCGLPCFFHWVWPEYHNCSSDVNFNKINEAIAGSEPVESMHEPVDVPAEEKKTKDKYGWLSPDGRFFGCDYGGHSSLAHKIVGEVEYVLNPERYLEDKGLAKILSGVEGRGRYSIGMGVGKKLTDSQIKVLQRMELDHSYGISYYL